MGTFNGRVDVSYGKGGGKVKLIIKDYFQGFVRGVTTRSNATFLFCIAIGIVTADKSDLSNRMAGVPIIFALLSAALHTVELPVMMYLVPLSKKQREDYIQKMLQIKILVPLTFACLWNLAAAALHPVSIYACCLQMVYILLCTYICGMLNNDNIAAVEKKTAYGGMKDFVNVILVSCYIEGVPVVIICMGSISKVEFWIILAIMLALMLPPARAAGKRWKMIRSNFATYETAIRTEG